MVQEIKRLLAFDVREPLKIILSYLRSTCRTLRIALDVDIVRPRPALAVRVTKHPPPRVMMPLRSRTTCVLFAFVLLECLASVEAESSRAAPRSSSACETLSSAHRAEARRVKGAERRRRLGVIIVTNKDISRHRSSTLTANRLLNATSRPSEILHPSFV